MKLETANKIGELLFYFFVTIMFVMKGLGLYDGQSVYKLLFVFSLFFVLLKVLISKYTIVEMILIVSIALVAIIVNRVSGEKGPIIVVAIIVGMYGVPLKRVMKIGVLSLGGSALINAILYMFRTPNVDAYLRTNRLNICKAYAWDLGQPHPNTTSIVYFAIVAMFLVCLNERYNIKHLLLLSLGNVAVYLFCVSNTGLIACEMLIISSFIFTKIKCLPWWCANVFNLGYPCCVLGSCIFPWVIPDSLSIYLKENALSLYGRIIQTRWFVTRDNLSFWGINVSSITDSKYVIENSFLYCIIFNGLIFFMLISCGYLFLVSMYVNKRRYMEICIIISFFIEGIMEPFLFNTSFKNITVFFLGECIWEYLLSKRKEKDKLIAVLDFSTFSLKVEEKVKSIYNAIVRLIDQIFEEKSQNGICHAKQEFITIVGALIVALVIIKNWPITNDFFSPSSVYDVLVEYNELDKGVVLETIRRFVFLYITNISIICIIRKTARYAYAEHKKMLNKDGGMTNE